jgi:hypothetical protein
MCVHFMWMTINDQRSAHPAPDGGQLEWQDGKDLATGQSVAHAGKMAHPQLFVSIILVC